MTRDGESISEGLAPGGADETSAVQGLNIERPTAIRERVYEALRDAIFSGRVAPGSRLVEARLADQLGVSRTPVREALHLMEREGLLESIRRTGYRVREITLAEMEEISEIRAANESLAVRWAVERMSEEDLRALEENLSSSESEIVTGRTHLFPDLDADFHDILVRASGSRRLQEMCHDLRRHMLLFRIESLHRPETARIALEGHRRILDALRNRDAECAIASVLTHLEEAKEGVRRDAFDEGRVPQPESKGSE